MSNDKKIYDFSRSLETGKRNALGFHESTLRCWVKDGSLYLPDLDLSLTEQTLINQKLSSQGKKGPGSKTIKKSKSQTDIETGFIEKTDASDEVDDLPPGTMKTRTVNSTRKGNRKVTTLFLASKEKVEDEDEVSEKRSGGKPKPQEETSIKEVRCKVWNKEELEAYHKWQDKNCISLTTEQQCKDLLETFKSQGYLIPIYYKGKNWLSKDDRKVIHQYAVLSMKKGKISVTFRINNQPYNNATQAIRHLNDLAGTKENEKIQGYLLFKVYVGKKFVLLQEIIPWEFRSKGRFSIESTRNKRASSSPSPPTEKLNTSSGSSKKQKLDTLDLGESDEIIESPVPVTEESEEEEDQESEAEEESTIEDTVVSISEITEKVPQKTVSSKALDESDLDTMFSSKTC